MMVNKYYAVSIVKKISIGTELWHQSVRDVIWIISLPLDHFALVGV